MGVVEVRFKDVFFKYVIYIFFLLVIKFIFNVNKLWESFFFLVMVVVFGNFYYDEVEVEVEDVVNVLVCVLVFGFKVL